jgi:hypothetical protein
MWGILKERDQLEDLGGDGRIILKLILHKQDAGRGLD